MKLLLSFCTILAFNQVLASSKNASILIIGAGPSGIAAATKLIKNGFTNLVILEAEDRIGGRINTFPFGNNNNIDLGAQWVHGEKGNVVFEMANPLNLLEHFEEKYDGKDPEPLVVLSNGEVIKSKDAGILFDLAKSSTKAPEINKFEGSIESFASKRFFESLKDEKYKHISQDVAEKFLKFYSKHQSILDAADSWDQVSAKGSASYEELEGDQYMNWKGKGYKTILDVMMKKIPDPSKDINLEKHIKFNTMANNIFWNDSGVIVRVMDSEEPLIVDHVIVTASLGVLKEKYQTLFTPSLPIEKQNAIKGLGFGTVDKIYVEFSEPFWNQNLDLLSLLWNEDDLKEIRDRKDSWIEDISVFSVVDYQPNILCGWIHGVKAREMEKFSDDEVLESTLFLLKKFMKKVNKFPEVVGFKRSKWYSNPNFRGSYSFKSIETDLLNATNEQLAEPVFDSNKAPKVLFAGEATSSNHYSTVHGAIETGWREANRLINFYKI